ncbi:hypothetical protein SAMN05216312_102277 [Cohnella sp. OV330]|nr:hypothetical protein SAMN05216312_102277 [Cohnella sp. OV330]
MGVLQIIALRGSRLRTHVPLFLEYRSFSRLCGLRSRYSSLQALDPSSFPQITDPRSATSSICAQTSKITAAESICCSQNAKPCVTGCGATAGGITVRMMSLGTLGQGGGRFTDGGVAGRRVADTRAAISRISLIFASLRTEESLFVAPGTRSLLFSTNNGTLVRNLLHMRTNLENSGR